jgi:hypothetical protein
MKCIDEMISAYRLPETDSDALSSMLMSWYISGFHTGIFWNILEGIMDKYPYNGFNLESSQETDHLKAVPGISSAQQHPFLRYPAHNVQICADLEFLVKLELSESYIIYNVYYYVLIMTTYVSRIEIANSCFR